LHSSPGQVFDKANVDFDHLHDLKERSVNWVTRAKSNMVYNVKRRQLKKAQGNIQRDDIIVLKNAKSKKAYPEELRRFVPLIEVKGQMVAMEFITNNMEWAASSVCDIYQSRWEIEVFFKQIKQNLKLRDFLGNNANAEGWQIWMALLTYVLLRYLGYISQWNHSFSRLCAMVRGV